MSGLKRRSVEDDSQNVSKKREKNDHECGDCQVRISLGSKEQFRGNHKVAYQAHPNAKWEQFSKYLSKKGKEIKLESNSCLCGACYADANKHAYSSDSDKMPRWVRIHGQINRTESHCKLCHFDEDLSSITCDCAAETKWRPGKTVKNN